MTRSSCPYGSLVVAVLIASVQAQSQSDPAFEVASIKKNTSGTTRQLMDGSGGRYTATNVPVRFLIQSAYRLQNMQLVGGPRWIDSDHFDIVASRGARSVDELPAMLRTLLGDRFALKVHHESRDMPMYTLVTARSDKTLGPRLTVAACVGRPIRSADAPVPDTDGGSVFTALQEQLGLKLTGGRGSVDVVVIDRISPPTEN
jgi:hypothetical protein